MSDTDIYCSAEIEALSKANEFSADVWARQFVNLMAQAPEMATDHGTMLAWFATAIMNGYDRGFAAGVDAGWDDATWLG